MLDITELNTKEATFQEVTKEATFQEVTNHKLKEGSLEMFHTQEETTTTNITHSPIKKRAFVKWNNMQ